MKMKLLTLFIIVFLTNSSVVAKENNEDTAVTDEKNNVTLSKEELRQALIQLPDVKKQLVLKDDDALIGSIKQLIENKILSQELDTLIKDKHSEIYWQYVFALRSLRMKVYMEHYKSTIDTPDMSELALEQYSTNSNNFSKIPETRLSSHILILCRKHRCDDEAKKKIAEEVLSKLKAGESFESLVSEYSEDPKSKANKGQLSEWYRLGHPRVDRDYTIALYELKNEGDVSDIVRTKHGYHIIRLDKIKAVTIKPYEEVKDSIITKLEAEYKQLAFYKRLRELQMSEDVVFSIEDIRNLIPTEDTTEAKEATD